ncbi:MAG: hypothetical protein ACLRRF_11445 [Clostridium fessum]
MGTAVEIRCLPILDICGRWIELSCRPGAEVIKLPVALTAVSAPVVCFFNSSRNGHTIAASELCQEVDMNAGVHEEDERMAVKVGFSESAEAERDIPSGCGVAEDVSYWDTLDQVRQWWEESNAACHGGAGRGQSRCALFWYSWHQDINALLLRKRRSALRKWDLIR